MSQGLFIIGTDTEVGKTVVAAGLLDLLLQKHYRAAYFKPIASGEILLDGVSRSLDACFVKTLSGFDEDESRITPFAFKNAVAPHLASQKEGRPIDMVVIQNALQYLKGQYEWIIAEGAGGLAVPLNRSGYMQYDLIRDLGFSCLLVARTGLGTINHTLLTLRYAQSLDIPVKGVVMNGYSGTEVERDNIAMIKQLAGVPAIWTLPRCEGVDTEQMQVGNLRDVMHGAIRSEEIIALMEAL